MNGWLLLAILAGYIVGTVLSSIIYDWWYR